MSTTTHPRQPVSHEAGGPAELVDLADLLARTGAGDTAAFAALYAATSARAYGLALRVIRDPELAEDITQDAYLSVWRTAARFDATRSSAAGWVLMIVHRVAVDHVRVSQARSDREDRHHRESSRLNQRGDDPTPDLAHASLDSTRAREALTCLTRIQRQSLELAYFNGHTYAEVATLIDVPLGTAKARIRDGLIRLRTALDSPVDNPPVPMT